MDKYVVFGNPVKHSLSPTIHRMFAQQTDQDMEYSTFLVERDFPTTAKLFFESGGKGANVTLPFKEEAFELVDDLSERARAAGAVNTFYVKEGKLIGDNTDGAGLVSDLQNLVGSLTGKRILLLGAGGAARGVIIPLFLSGISSLQIANRTEAKANSLALQFQHYGEVSSSGFLDIPELEYDIIINSTSSSISGDVPPIDGRLLHQAQMAYDMFYQSKPTSFMRFAIQSNSKILTSDGVGMLVGQAAESFYLWRGVRPETKCVIDELKTKLV